MDSLLNLDNIRLWIPEIIIATAVSADIHRHTKGCTAALRQLMEKHPPNEPEVLSISIIAKLASTDWKRRFQICLTND